MPGLVRALDAQLHIRVDYICLLRIKRTDMLVESDMIELTESRCFFHFQYSLNPRHWVDYCTGGSHCVTGDARRLCCCLRCQVQRRVVCAAEHCTVIFDADT